MKDLVGMIPGVGKQIKDLDISDDSLKGKEKIIDSMTPRQCNPDLVLIPVAGSEMPKAAERILQM